MAAQNFTPPYPFEHRVSPEDILAYNEAVDRDEVRKLFRAWSAEDEQRAAVECRHTEEQKRQDELRSTLQKLEQNSDAMRSATELNSKSWLTRQEAADYLGISARTIDRKREAGVLNGYLVEGTRTYRFKKEDVEALMA